MSTLGMPLERWEGFDPVVEPARVSGTRLRDAYDPWDEYTPAGLERTQPSMRLVLAVERDPFPERRCASCGRLACGGER